MKRRLFVTSAAGQQHNPASPKVLAIQLIGNNNERINYQLPYDEKMDEFFQTGAQVDVEFTVVKPKKT